MNSPVLSQRKLRQLLSDDMFGDSHAFIDLNVADSLSLPAALDQICEQADKAVRDGKLILMLSDRYLARDKLPVHALLATGAVHHHLVRLGLRCDANIIVETGVARDPHHIACLIGYGATAVYPYLVYQSLYDIARHGTIGTQPELGRSFRRGIRKGLFKIMSKMGISSISSYRGAQLFEIVGLHDEVVNRCFKGTTSRIQGTGFDDLLDDQKQLVTQGGLLKYVHGGEYHCYNPDVIATLQAAVRTGDFSQYLQYAQLVNERPVATLRDLMALKPAGPAVPLDEVESVEDILPRFDSAGMSLGALSPEAHEALAIAMNRIGARSNSGEGGEDPARYGTERGGHSDKNRPGRETGRGRAAPGPQGEQDDRAVTLRETGCRPHFPAATSRYLFDRRPCPADFRSQAGEPEGAGFCKAGCRAWSGNDCGGRRQGLCRPDHDFRLRRRHGREPAQFGQVCG
jgi:glutamate synthase (NADPH/NADH) large chain